MHVYAGALSGNHRLIKWQFRFATNVKIRDAARTSDKLLRGKRLVGVSPSFFAARRLPLDVPTSRRSDSGLPKKRLKRRPIAKYPPTTRGSSAAYKQLNRKYLYRFLGPWPAPARLPLNPPAYTSESAFRNSKFVICSSIVAIAVLHVCCRHRKQPGSPAAAPLGWSIATG